MKMRLLSFAFVLITLGFGFSSYSAVGSDLLSLDDIEMTKTPDLGHTKIYELVDHAQSSVHMMIYHLSDEILIQKLIEAKQRGVEVTIIMDNQNASNKSGTLIYDKLVSSGINAVKSSKGFSITHVKSFSVDNKIIFLSTMNFIKSFSLMRDFGLTTSEQSLIQEFENVFQTDLKNSQNGGKDTPNLSAPNLVWSPVNSRDKITQYIDAAQNDVQVTVENLTDSYVIASLGNAAKRGLKVRVLTPECVLGGTYNNERGLKILTEAGVMTRVIPSPSSNETPYMHAKTFVVDKQIGFLGSENYSLNSLSYARELGVLFKNPKAIEFLDETFEQDWAKSIKYADLAPNHCDKPGVNIGDELQD